MLVERVGEAEAKGVRRARVLHTPRRSAVGGSSERLDEYSKYDAYAGSEG